MSRFVATGFLTILAAVAVQGCARTPAMDSLSLGSIQGAWWSDCEDPSAEFVVEGSEYSGDFAGTYKLQLTDDVLVFADGLLAGHDINVTHEPLSFRVLGAGPGELVLRPMPGNPYVGDWRLTSCEHAPSTIP